MEFIITMTQSNTDKNAQAFVHSDAANVHRGHILKPLLHGGAVCYKKTKTTKKTKTEKGNSLATAMVQSYFPIGANIANIKIKAVLYLVMLASC